MLPTLRQLQYLVAVVDTCHFGQAAERCFVTQSTLSSGIQELEQALGVVLLERTKRRVVPTPLGVRMAKSAVAILDSVQQLAEMAKTDRELLSGILRLGVIPTIGPYLLPAIMGELHNRFPQLDLYLREERSRTLLREVENGDLDAAVLAFPYDVGILQKQLFWQENFQVVLPESHPLASSERITSDSLPVDELLMLEEGHCLRDHALAACHLRQRAGGQRFEGTSLYTLMQMVASGLGMTFVPEMALRLPGFELARTVLRPLAEPGPHREIGLVWRPSYPRQDDLHRLADSMGEILRADPANPGQLV